MSETTTLVGNYYVEELFRSSTRSSSVKILQTEDTQRFEEFDLILLTTHNWQLITMLEWASRHDRAPTFVGFARNCCTSFYIPTFVEEISICWSTALVCLIKIDLHLITHLPVFRLTSSQRNANQSKIGELGFDGKASGWSPQIHRISTYPPTNPRSARCSSVSLLQIISLTATSFSGEFVRNDFNLVTFEGCRTKKYSNTRLDLYLGFRWITFRRYGQGSEAHVNDGTYFSKKKSSDVKMMSSKNCRSPRHLTASFHRGMWSQAAEDLHCSKAKKNFNKKAIHPPKKLFFGMFFSGEKVSLAKNHHPLLSWKKKKTFWPFPFPFLWFTVCGPNDTKGSHAKRFRDDTSVWELSSMPCMDPRPWAFLGRRMSPEDFCLAAPPREKGQQKRPQQATGGEDPWIVCCFCWWGRCNYTFEGPMCSR